MTIRLPRIGITVTPSTERCWRCDEHRHETPSGLCSPCHTHLVEADPERTPPCRP